MSSERVEREYVTGPGTVITQTERQSQGMEREREREREEGSGGEGGRVSKQDIYVIDDNILSKIQGFIVA